VKYLLKRKQTKKNQNTLTVSQNINTSNDVNTLAAVSASNYSHPAFRRALLTLKHRTNSDDWRI